MRTQLVARDGAPLGVHVWGRGRPLVLLPGLTLGPVCLAPLLLGRHERCVAVDPRGVSGSRPWSGDLTVDDYADDVVDALDRLGLPQVDLLGLSFGSVVAQRLLVRAPERLRRAVLLCPPTGHHPGRVALLERLERRAAAGDLRGTWAELGPWLVGPRLARRARPVLRGAGSLVPPLFLRTDGPAAATELRALLALPDAAVEDLRAVRTPVLLVHGDRDRLAPPGDAARLQAVLPDARRVTVPRAGHLAALRRPTVVRALRSFLRPA